jgi:outer membrane protein insertion porin family
MRIVIGSLFLLSFGCAGVAQASAQAPEAAVQVRTLTIVASDLPEADRQRIEDSLQGGTYGLEELAERARQNLRDLGYYSAHVETPQLSAINEFPPSRSADVSIQVEPGAQYRLGEIAFQGASVFPPDQLRRQFLIEAGSLFNATRIGKGLEGLKDLYLEKGYVNFGAIPVPRIDEARRVIDLTIDVDEGKPYDFGRLVMDGIEPRAGVAKALLAAWAAVEGKRYNPQILAKWLAANAPSLQRSENSPDRVTTRQDQAAHRIDVQLEFP